MRIYNIDWSLIGWTVLVLAFWYFLIKFFLSYFKKRTKSK